MDYAIELLKSKREALLLEIKAGENNKVKERVEIETAINWLKQIQLLGLKQVKKCEFITLPDMQTGWSEYHLMNDCESGNIDHWIELKDENNDPVTLFPGDILISVRS